MSLSRRYARALLEIAQRTHSIESTAASLDDLNAALQDNPELREILRNPMFPPSKRRAILESVTKAIQAPEHLQIFLGFIFDKDRMEIVREMSLVFRRLADEMTGTIRGELASAIQLDSQQVESLSSAFNKLTGHKVALNIKQDASLLGGAVARVGDVIFDGSLRAQLRQIKESLLSVDLNPDPKVRLDKN